MACFIVPATEAIVVTAATLIVKAKEKKSEPQTFTYEAKDGSIATGEKVSLSRKLSWLCYLLFGGSVLLAYEHIWHGEVTAWFPYLTAMSSPGSMSEMFHEMATAGVLMSVIVTLVWACMVLVSNAIEKKTIAARAIYNA